jgi:hypothetical protein
VAVTIGYEEGRMEVDLELQHRERTAPRWLETVMNRAHWLARMDTGARRRRAHGGGAMWLGLLPPKGLASGGFERRPITLAGVAASAGLLVGAAIVARRRFTSNADNPEEIIARALCREDPDTPTHRGPLWTGYRNDARRVLAALVEAGLLVNASKPR